MSISFRTARSTIENALLDELRLALGRRLPPVQSTDDLAQFPSTAIAEESLRHVRSAERTYRWQPWNTVAPDGAETVAPLDLKPGSPGRWVRTDSVVVTGYLRRCELYNEDEDEETMNARILGEKPALLVSFDSARHKPVSNRAGALYWYIATYAIIAISTSMRGGQAARQGSRRAQEAAEDPGTAAMLGDAKAVLAGSSLGLEDVERVELGEEKPVIVALAKRTVVEQLEVIVWSTVSTDDSDEMPLEAGVQHQLASADSQQLVDFGPTDTLLPAPQS